MTIKAIITSSKSNILDEIRRLYPDIKIIFKENFFANEDDFAFQLDRSIDEIIKENQGFYPVTKSFKIQYDE